MKNTLTQSATENLRAALRRVRSRNSATLSLLAVTSLAGFKLTAKADEDFTRRAKALTSERATDDETREDTEIGFSSALALADEVAPQSVREIDGTLTIRERQEIAASRPGSRSLVLRRAPVIALDDPLPEGFTPSPVEDFAPVASASLLAEIDAETREESAAEVAATLAAFDAELARDLASRYAVAFVSDWNDHPTDYAPDGSTGKIAQTKRAPIMPRTFNRPAPVAPVSRFEAMRAAFLAS